MKKIDEHELKEIFLKIKKGENDGIELLYKKYHDLIYGMVFSILKNKENSEDVVQDVFAKILKLEADKFPSQGEASWLYTVTKNETFQFLRKQKQNIDIDELYSLESESDEIDDIVDMSSYYKLIENLKPIDKEIISLRILSDFTFEKIAQMLDMPIGTVEWRYYKSIHSIKLSISSLAAFLIVYNIWSITKNFSNNISADSELDTSSSVESNQNYKPSFNSEIDDFNSFDGMDVASIKGYDTSGASGSVGRISNTIANLVFTGISIILIILTIVFALKRKIKIKNRKI